VTRQRLRTAAAATVFAASVFLLGVWAAAGPSQAMQARMGTITVPSLAMPPAPNPAALAATLARPLFNPDRKPAPVPEAQDDAAPGASPATGLIAVAIGPDRSAAILKLATGRTAVLMQGEQIDGWTLKVVAPHRVVLRSSSGQAQFFLGGGRDPD
jgi:hypothetical protein